MQQVVYVTSTSPVEIRAPRKGRRYLEIYNASANDVFYGEDTQSFDRTIATATRLEYGEQLGKAVPQGSIWIIGSQVGAQKVLIKDSTPT